MRAARVLRRVCVGLAIVVVLVAMTIGAAGYVAIHAPLPEYGGTLRITGLTAEVTVDRDRYGVPQVYATNADDLFRAQGYLQATDRFWEMDFRRHVTAGRLSELFGSGQVDTDAYVRTLGWRRVAEQELPMLDPQTRHWLESYAEGVNAWIAKHPLRDSGWRKRFSAGTGFEYSVVRLTNPDYRIEKWTPVDSLSWLKAMAWDLRSNLPEELDRARLIAAGMSRAQVEELYPAYPFDRHAPIVTSGAVVDGTFQPGAAPTGATSGDRAGGGRTAGGGGGEPATPDRSTDSVLRSLLGTLGNLGDEAGALPQLLGTGAEGIGSNGWVISGKRTTTGRPILANDPHLGPTMPSVWYQMGLHCTRISPTCPFDVTGVTFSGLPGVIIGHNSRIAWGFTNLQPDVADLYLERITGDTYQRGSRQEPLVTRKETIEVAGGKPVTITVRSTVHGPLLSDRDADLREVGKRPAVDSAGVPTAGAQRPSPSYGVALRWTALDPGRTADALFALNRAANFAEFRAAAALFLVPSQNLVYADVDGHIGYQAPGAIPVRGSGDGRYPAPGWDPAYDWRGTVPFARLPYAYDPPAGYIATANQAVVNDPAGPILTRDWDYGYRSQRISDLITGAGGKVDVDAVAQMQLDTRNENAAQIVPSLLSLGSGDLRRTTRPAVALLAEWDYSQPANSAAAAYFNAVWRQLLRRTFDELPDDLAPAGGSRWFEVVRGFLAQPDSHWWDVRSTKRVESRDDILKAALDSAADELRDRLGHDPDEWRWGDLHTLTVRNQSLGDSGISPIEWLVNRGPIPVAGGGSTVDANAWNAAEGYEVNWVPSMRMIVDLRDFDESRWINLTGASGHPFSAHYADQLELWQTGRTIPMRWLPDTISDEAKYHQRFTP